MDASETPKAVAKCPVRMHGGRECGREAYDGRGRCICHSEKPDKDIQAFNAAVEEVFASQDLDFTRFVFPEDVRFGTRVFASNASFWEAKFKGNAHFGGAQFQGGANFWGAGFHGEADFGGAAFRGRASLGGATFHGAAYFGAASFQSEADFGCARFHGAVYFGGPTYRGGIVRMAFGRWDTFSREVDVDFRFSRFHQPEKVVFHQVFLGRGQFLGTDVRRVDFTDVEWAKRPFWRPRWLPMIGRGGRFAVWDELMTPEPRRRDHALIGKLYRQLKHNYEEQRDPITAGDFHFGEMHMRRLSDPPKNRLLRLLKRNLSFLALYRWISGYGEDYALALGWIVAVIVGFAAAFAYLPALALQTAPSSPPHPVHGLWPHLVYSVMCLLFRGDKPFVPVHFGGQCASVVEGVIGAPLIAMFVLALNRRFKR